MSEDSPRSFWKTLVIMIAGVGILIFLFVILPELPDLFGLQGVWAIPFFVIAVPIEAKIIHWIHKQPSCKRSGDTTTDRTPSG